jgi:hypothetical protein
MGGNIKIHLKDLGYEGVGRIQVEQDKFPSFEHGTVYSDFIKCLKILDQFPSKDFASWI